MILCEPEFLLHAPQPLIKFFHYGGFLPTVFPHHMQHLSKSVLSFVDELFNHIPP